jgi:hypothetical protein
MPDGGEKMIYMDVVLQQMYHGTARLKCRECEVSRVVGLCYTPVVFGACHRRAGLRQARHSVRERLLVRRGKARRRRCYPGRRCGKMSVVICEI